MSTWLAPTNKLHFAKFAAKFKRTFGNPLSLNSLYKLDDDSEPVFEFELMATRTPLTIKGVEVGNQLSNGMYTYLICDCFVPSEEGGDAVALLDGAKLVGDFDEHLINDFLSDEEELIVGGCPLFDEDIEEFFA